MAVHDGAGCGRRSVKRLSRCGGGPAPCDLTLAAGAGAVASRAFSQARLCGARTAPLDAAQEYRGAVKTKSS